MPRVLGKPWLVAFTEYMKFSDAPPNFVWWAGVSAAAAMLKRNIWFKRRLITIYPNQYIVFIGPPGSGKGSAMGPTINILKKAGVTWMIRDRISAEKIISRLDNGFAVAPIGTGTGAVVKKDASMILVATELAILLETSPWMLTALCKMWDDNEFEYDTKNRGTHAVKDVCVSVLGACVPRYIQNLANSKHMEAVSGGFSSRCIFPYIKEARHSTAREFWDDPDDTKNAGMELKENALVEDLKAIGTLRGEYIFTKKAADLFADYVVSLTPSAGVSESEVITNFKSRLWAHMGKATLCITASEGESKIIQEHHVLEAYTRIKEVYDGLDLAFRFVSESTFGEGMLKVMDYIEANGAVMHKQLLRTFHKNITAEDLSRIMLTLEGIDFVFRKNNGGNMHYIHNKGFKV